MRIGTPIVCLWQSACMYSIPKSLKNSSIPRDNDGTFKPVFCVKIYDISNLFSPDGASGVCTL